MSLLATRTYCVARLFSKTHRNPQFTVAANPLAPWLTEYRIPWALNTPRESSVDLSSTTRKATSGKIARTFPIRPGSIRAPFLFGTTSAHLSPVSMKSMTSRGPQRRRRGQIETIAKVRVGQACRCLLGFTPWSFRKCRSHIYSQSYPARQRWRSRCLRANPPCHPQGESSRYGTGQQNTQGECIEKIL